MSPKSLSTPQTAVQLQLMRPTLIVGAGGTGQKIITYLKLILGQQYGDEWRQKVRLLAFDTTEELFTVASPDGDVVLEPTTEFISIGNVPVPSIMRNIETHRVIQERLGSIMAALPPMVLRNGAKQIRPFGLLSLLWNYKPVSDKISQALWFLAGRDQLDNTTLAQQQGINVFICGSMVGGTGSGTFLELAHLIRNDFDNLGTQAEFCHITGIGLLHQAFRGVKGPNLLPNAGASLEELHHLMCKKGFKASYPDGRIINSHEAPYNLYYVIDGIDERGQTWPTLNHVCHMVAQGIFLQMGSQIGREGENAFDNMNEVLSEQSATGEGHILSSFGIGHLTFDAPAVADIHAAWFLRDVISHVWLAEAATPDTVPLLIGLEATQLADRLQKDPQTNGLMRIDLTPPGWLQEKPAEELPAEATRYVREYGHARVQESFIPQIISNGEHIHRDTLGKWEEWLRAALLSADSGLPTLLATLQTLSQQLTEFIALAHKQGRDLEQQQTEQQETLMQQETAVAHAAHSFFLGRNARLRQALPRTFHAAQTLYETQLRRQRSQTQQQLWHNLNEWVQQQETAVCALITRLQNMATQLRRDGDEQLVRLSQNEVATISLAQPDYVHALYQQHQPTAADVKTLLPDPLALCQMPTDDLQAHLLQLLRPAFHSVVQIGIEQAIKDQSHLMAPNARRQQLFRLATPSWNLDRTRLPHGGEGLARLEVLGVPDEAHTLFTEEPMRVSTRDPYRLTALTVAAGAPPSALRQYDLYQQALKRHNKRRPLHVLPDFLTTTDQGRLMFALGSIFGLIYSQGTFFYYQPADSLENPVKLANGLTNAINAFMEQDGLVHLVSERIEAQIASLGLRDAIQLLADYYNSTSDGNSALDNQLRELKQLVRNYTESLRKIDAFSVGIPHAVNGKK